MTIDNIIEEAQELTMKIRHWANSYYLGGSDHPGDLDFDKAVERLRELDPNNPVLGMVGWGLSTHGDMVKLPMLIQHSLPKIHSISEYPIYDHEDLLVTPKLDGLSAILEYDQNGHLKLACTRGDGNMGVNITHKIQYLKNWKDLQRAHPNAIIRGELLIANAVFEVNLKEVYANSRNGCAGIINSKSLERLEYVEFHAHEPMLEFKYPRVNYIILDPNTVGQYHSNFGREKDADALFEHAYKTFLSGDLPIDGIVINGEVAYKFATVEVEATVVKVNWGLTPRGNMVPVAEIEPVQLYGATVTNVSCFHVEYVMENFIGAGSKLMVTRANEIIPYITKVLTKSEDAFIPHRCPKCHEILYREGVHLACVTPKCRLESHIHEFVYHFLTVKGVTDSAAICRILKIDSWESIVWYLLPDNLGHVGSRLASADGWGRSRAEAIERAFRAFAPAAEDFVRGLAIKNVGHSASEAMAKHLDINEFEELLKVVDLASHTRESLEKHWRVYRDAWWYFKAYIKAPKEVVEFTQSVILTGKMSKPRGVIEQELNAVGCRVVGVISSDTQYVVAADVDGQSSKLKAARKKNVEIINEMTLRRLYGI